MLTHSRIYLDALVIGERQRQVDPERVDALAKSLAEIGLQQPISIWAEKDEVEGAPDTLHLIAGLHRVRAAEKLGWEQIDAMYVDLDSIDRRRWEIAENLHRSELTALERDQHIAEWERLSVESEKLRKESAVLEGPGGRGKKGGAREVARRLGIDEKQVRNARATASLTDEAKTAAVEYGIDDNRSKLLRVAKAGDDAEAQLAEIERIEDERVQKEREKAERQRQKTQQPPAPSAEPAPEPEWTEADESAFTEIVAKLNDASPQVRAAVIDYLSVRAAA